MMDMSTPNYEQISGDIRIVGYLKTQGGGHGEIQKSIYNSTSISAIAKPYITREDNFYRAILPSPLSLHTCRYMGSHISEGKRWLLLQDQTQGMSSPCILDIKLGTRSFEIGASPEKVKAQLDHMKNTTTSTHAIRIIDARMRKDNTVTYKCDRVQGHNLNIKEVEKLLRTFFPGKRKHEFIEQICKIRSALLETIEIFPKMRLYSASILAVYDGDSDAPMRVTIIDFAHAYLDVDVEGGDSTDPFYDDNAIKGLQSLIDLLIHPMPSHEKEKLERN
ncbi:inositol hexakisphosphate kinase [Histomonas meleagridis]|uniref:inositol hexakisphosphate kinase n=1 Tax=Histomonas meleagridis TaxID=135588 RepID=UPI00355A243B|nr:inositol hexakisphosphate kinase [Histomonas meleagridis]KAH0797954.1 inositol hexakisphosphate kinase [Histomonas meleagridis]